MTNRDSLQHRSYRLNQNDFIYVYKCMNHTIQVTNCAKLNKNKFLTIFLLLIIQKIIKNAILFT